MKHTTRSAAHALRTPKHGGAAIAVEGHSRVLINTTRPLQEGRYPAMDGGAPAVKHNAHNLRTPSTGAAIAWPCCQFGRSAAKMRGRRLRFLNRCGQTELCRSQVRSPLEYSTLTLCARAGGCGQSHDEGIDLNLLKLLKVLSDFDVPSEWLWKGTFLHVVCH